MNGERKESGVILLQKYLLIGVIIILAVSIGADHFNEKVGLILNYVSVAILIIAAPIRIISVSEYFRKSGDKKYQALSYVVIGIIAIVAILKALF